MPGVLVNENLDPASSVPNSYPAASPHSSPSLLSPLRHYIPVLTRSIAPEFCDGGEPPSHLSPIHRRAGLCLNVNARPEMYAEDGNLLEPGLLLQLSPVSATQWGGNGASPTTLSALSAHWRFLPSNFEEDDGAYASQTELYSGDEFRMYEFKVRRCMRGRSHDWTECPFAHPGEKARRRDPKRFHYSGTACTDFRKGGCKKGDECEFAHGVFECWLHPSRYRTQPCKDGRGCHRRICFFAHTPDQLRFVSPIASPSAMSSPTSRQVSSAMEAFDLCTPFSSPCMKALSEPFPSPLSSSPLGRMAMEASADAIPVSNFSLIAPSSLSPPLSPSPSPPEVPINWSPRGVSPYTLPIPASVQRHPSSHYNHIKVSPSPVLAHSRHLENVNLSIPSSQTRSKSALPSPTSSSCTTAASTQQIDDLMSLLKQADLEQQEPAWLQASRGVPLQLGSFSTARSRRGACSVPVTPTKMGFRDEEFMNGGFFDDEDEGGESGEPKLERVESGKGLRAQIFESLLRSASQRSCRNDQDSNSQPSRSSSSLGC